MSTTQASLDGFPLIGTTPEGGRSRLREMPGWLEVSMRRVRTSKAGQDGDWPTFGLQDGMQVTASGQIEYGDDAAGAALERRRMLTLGGRGTCELTVTDALGSLTARVEVDGARAVPGPRDTLTRWAFVLHQADPLLYGPPLFASTGLSAAAGGAGLVFPLTFPLDFGIPPGVTPGAITLANSGTATYWPRLRIDGPVTNPVVSMAETGDWIRVARTVDAGQWLDIDLGERRVLLNGLVSVRNQTTYAGAWLGVPPGGGSLSWTADTADPAARLSVWSYESAWN